MQSLLTNSKFESHIFLTGECVRRWLLCQEIRNIEMCCDLENGHWDFAVWLTKELDCYKEGINPYRQKDGSVLFNIENDELLKDYFVSIYQTRLNPSYAVEEGTSNLGTLLDDTLLKDISANAMYLDVSDGSIYDPTDGCKDIEEQVIRLTNKPEIIFKDNPIVMLKIIKYASQWQWNIEQRTWMGILKHHELIKTVPMEQIRWELNDILLSIEPSFGLDKLLYSGMMFDLFPHLYALGHLNINGESVLKHTFDVCDGTDSVLKTRLAALFHDVGKPCVFDKKKFAYHDNTGRDIAAKVLTDLGYSDGTIDDVKAIIKNHHYFDNCSKNHVPRQNKLRIFIKLCNGNVRLAEQCLDLMKSNTGYYDVDSKLYIAQIEDAMHDMLEMDEQFSIKLPINGEDIMTEFSFKGSKLIGLLLGKVREACKEKPNMTRQEALDICKAEIATVIAD